jgi:hypothetical protein
MQRSLKFSTLLLGAASFLKRMDETTVGSIAE